MGAVRRTERKINFATFCRLAAHSSRGVGAPGYLITMIPIILDFSANFSSMNAPFLHTQSSLYLRATWLSKPACSTPPKENTSLENPLGCQSERKGTSPPVVVSLDLSKNQCSCCAGWCATNSGGVLVVVLVAVLVVVLVGARTPGETRRWGQPGGPVGAPLQCTANCNTMQYTAI